MLGISDYRISINFPGKIIIKLLKISRFKISFVGDNGNIMTVQMSRRHMIYFILFLQRKINKIPKNLEMISNERRETRDRQLRQKVYCKKKHTSVVWKLRFKVARGLLRAQ